MHIRSFWEEWTRTYEDWEAHPEEMVDLGGGVTLAVVTQKGRIPGSSGDVRLRYASVAMGTAAFLVTRRSTLAGVVCGEVFMLAGKWWIG